MNKKTDLSSSLIILLIFFVSPLFNGRKYDILFVIIPVVLMLIELIKRNVIKLYTNKYERNVIRSGIFYIVGLLMVFLFNNSGLSDFERIIQFIFCLITLIYFMNINNGKNKYDLLKKIAYITIIISFGLFFLTGLPKIFYGLYSHFNTLGTTMMLCLMVIVISNFKNEKRTTITDVFISLIGIIVLIASTNRSALLTLLLFYSLIIIKKLFRRDELYFRIIFIGLIVFIFWFIIIYPNLYGTDLGNTLEIISRNYFHKNFFSGRQIIWKEILDAMTGHEILGLGLSTIPEMIYSTNFSSHNLYLQTYLQGGLLNIAFLIIYIRSIFLCFLKEKKGKIKAFGIAFFISIVFHECFEVTLLQNQMNLALVYWMILGLLISIQEKSDDFEKSKI